MRRCYLVTIPHTFSGVFTALYLRSARACLPRPEHRPEVITGGSSMFTKAVTMIGFTAFEANRVLELPADYRQRVPELMNLFTPEEETAGDGRPRVVIAYPQLVDVLDGAFPGQPEAIYRVRLVSGGFGGFEPLFENGQQVGP